MPEYSPLTPEELLLKLRTFEDGSVERKTVGDSKDWRATVVGFANGAPIGYPAVLFIGAKNDGTIEDRDANLDTVQRTLGKEVAQAYPPIYYDTRIVSEGGRQCLAVIVPGSPNRPHFAGPSYVRVGSETKVASESQFAALIADRNGKAREIRVWKGKKVHFEFWTYHPAGSNRASDFVEIADVNQHYVTYTGGNTINSIPLDRIRVSFDNERQVLKLEIDTNR